MNQQNRMSQNLALESRTKENSRAEKTRFIVNMVNPRFQNYNRPLLLAILVGGLTFVLMIITFSLVMSAEPKKTWVSAVPKIDEVRTTSGSCTTMASYPQVFGSYYYIRTFMKQTVNPSQATTDENVKVSINADLCLNSEVTMLVYTPDQSASFINLNGLNYQERCFVPDEFKFGWNTVVGNAELCGNDVRWCWVNNHNADEDIKLKFCDGLYERYGI